MATYVSLRATAQRLIQKNGRSVTFRRKSTTLIDINNPQLGIIGAIDVTVKASFVNVLFTNRGRNLVQTGDLMCLIAADDLLGFIPNTSNIIIDAGINYHIVDFQSVDPSDTPIVYQFLLRA